MKKAANKPYIFYGILIVAAIATIIVAALLMHIQTLSSRITTLENREVSLSAQLASYERSLCANSYEITGVNKLTRYTLTSAGYERSYQVHTPDTYDPSARYPVIISFDGIDGSGSQMRSYSGLDAVPAIVVYPDSLPGKEGYTAWQGAPYSLDGDYDIQFVRALLNELPSNYCVDSTQLFVVGMSNGGAFATIVGCELGDQIRAVASVSGAYYTTCQPEERTPSLLLLHSLDDQRVPLMGETARRLPQVPKWAVDQAASRECQTVVPSTLMDATTYYNWLDCSDNSMLRLVVLQGQQHGWLTMPRTPGQGIQSTAGYIWQFFEESVHYS